MSDQKQGGGEGVGGVGSSGGEEAGVPNQRLLTVRLLDAVLPPPHISCSPISFRWEIPRSLPRTEALDQPNQQGPG